MEQPNFFAIIPANVRYARGMPDGAKLLYGEITALANKEGYCYAQDTYFADLYGKSERTIRSWIVNLEKQGHINRVHIYKEGTKEIQSRRLYVSGGVAEITTQGAGKEVPKGVEENCQAVWKKTSKGVEKNCQDNNTSLIKDIIVHLNKKANKNFNYQAKGNQKFIIARLNEGYILDDFIKVIDNKIADNAVGKFDDMYLRPETLFGNKFDGYLNQAPRNKAGENQNTCSSAVEWEKVREAVRKFPEATSTTPITEFLGQKTWSVVEVIGWSRLCDMNDYNRNQLQREFETHYRE